MIVRENSEGEYSGNGGRAHRGLPEEVGTEVAIFTRVGVTRIMRYAFKLAQARPRKLLTVVTKSNAQRHGMVMWDEIAAEVAEEFPDVTWDKMLVDAMTVRMTLRPQSLDTIVATNLHADILSDLAGALAGSIGVAPTANIDPQRRFPSMFEPIHGSAFDLTGKGIANPVATWTAAQMLEHLGEQAAAAHLMRAVETVTGAGILTRMSAGRPLPRMSLTPSATRSTPPNGGTTMTWDDRKARAALHRIFDVAIASPVQPSIVPRHLDKYLSFIVLKSPLVKARMPLTSLFQL